jgi:hypothetical protein
MTVFVRGTNFSLSMMKIHFRLFFFFLLRFSVTVHEFLFALLEFSADYAYVQWVPWDTEVKEFCVLDFFFFLMV